jgi:hypothetical protein
MGSTARADQPGSTPYATLAATVATEQQGPRVVAPRSVSANSQDCRVGARLRQILRPPPGAPSPPATKHCLGPPCRPGQEIPLREEWRATAFTTPREGMKARHRRQLHNNFLAAAGRSGGGGRGRAAANLGHPNHPGSDTGVNLFFCLNNFDGRRHSIYYLQSYFRTKY